MVISFSEQAVFDLDSIRNYFRQVAAYKEEDVIASILDRVDQLVSFPQSGPEDEFLKFRGLSRRYLIEGNYKIIYRIDKEILSITQIFDARQNPEKMLKSEE